MTKKILSYLLTLTILLSIIGVVPLVVGAENEADCSHTYGEDCTQLKESAQSENLTPSAGILSFAETEEFVTISDGQTVAEIQNILQEKSTWLTA